MAIRRYLRLVICVGAPVVLAMILAASHPLPAVSQDFFDFMFGGAGSGRSQPSPPSSPWSPWQRRFFDPRDPSRSRYFEQRLPYGADDYDPPLRRRLVPRSEQAPDRLAQTDFPGETAYCVRLCDGRYFPLAAVLMTEQTLLCRKLCPASPTEVFQGSSIDAAFASDGTRYEILDNAFVYRRRLVEGCTCNGKDAFGLASLSVNDDPTLRKGDIVSTDAGAKRVIAIRERRKATVFSDVDLRFEIRQLRARR